MKLRNLGDGDLEKTSQSGCGYGNGRNTKPSSSVDETVPPDGESKRDDCNHREPRTTNELAERVAQVLEERIHLGPLSRLR